jgi:hypothetical protein
MAFGNPNPAPLHTLLLGVLIASASITGAAFYQHNAAQRSIADNAQMSAALRHTRETMELSTSRFHALEATARPAESPRFDPAGARLQHAHSHAGEPKCHHAELASELPVPPAEAAERNLPAQHKP